MTDSYDEDALRSRLHSLPRLRKAGYAAACAELLAPVWPRYAQLTGRDGRDLLNETLGQLWAALEGGAGDLAQRLADLEAHMPDEDDDPWVFESGYAQNAAAGTAYAIETLLHDDTQKAAWAARQVWEAADLSAENEDASPRFIPPQDMHGPATSTDVVSAAVSLLSTLLELVESENFDLQGLRGQAQDSAALWWASLAPL